jgi:hypothetical protein
MILIYGEHILGSVFPLLILTAHVWECCHRTALPRSSRYIWGIYHIVRTKFSLPCWLVRALCYWSLCRNLFQFAITYKFMAATIEPQSCKQMAAWRRITLYKNNRSRCRLLNCEIIRHVNCYSEPRHCGIISKAGWLIHWGDWLRAGRSGFNSWQRKRFSVLHNILKALDTFSLLSSGYQGIHHGVNQTEPETDHSCLMQTLRIRGVIPLPPHTSSSLSDN